MKTRKKTKLCLQCNGVNPLSATHCAYCGAALQNEDLASEELQTPYEGLNSSASQPAKKEPVDVFSRAQGAASSPYHAHRASQTFAQDRELASHKEVSVDKPLYSVFDQPPSYQPSHGGDGLNQLKEGSRHASSSKITHAIKARLELAKCKIKAACSQGWSLEAFKEWLGHVSISSAILLGVLGLLTLIFNEHGKVILSWSKNVWPWLLLPSGGLFLMGWYLSRPE